jgi:hypothetical protein
VGDFENVIKIVFEPTDIKQITIDSKLITCGIQETYYKSSELCLRTFKLVQLLKNVNDNFYPKPYQLPKKFKILTNEYDDSEYDTIEAVKFESKAKTCFNVFIPAPNPDESLINYDRDYFEEQKKRANEAESKQIDFQTFPTFPTFPTFSTFPNSNERNRRNRRNGKKYGGDFINEDENNLLYNKYIKYKNKYFKIKNYLSDGKIKKYNDLILEDKQSNIDYYEKYIKYKNKYIKAKNLNNK